MTPYDDLEPAPLATAIDEKQGIARYPTRMSLTDENAVFLANMVNGIDLSVPRTIGFAHLFHSEFSAMQFKRAAENAGYLVQVKLFPPFEVEEAKAWDVVASEKMVPSVEQITRCEMGLAALAKQFGGQADGWSFENS